MECDVIVGLVSVRGDGECIAPHRRPGRPQPLLPLLGALRLPVGVQEEIPAEGTSSVLRLKQA